MSGSLWELMQAQPAPAMSRLQSLAAAPVQPRGYDVAPEPAIPTGAAVVQQQSQNFPLDPIDPTALRLRGMDPQTMGQTREQSRLAELFLGMAGTTPIRGGVRAFHGGPGSYEWVSGNSQRGAIDKFRASPDNPAFFAASPNRASEYAVARYPERAAVYPVELDQGAMLSWDQSQKWLSNSELAALARQRGANVVEIRNAYDGITDGSVIPRIQEALGRPIERGPETIYMVLDPAAISTPFGRR